MMIVVCLVWSLSLGGFNIVQGSEQTYKGLKMFSDVIEIIERNYVDPVESEKLIHGAIQGMVSSLDPHSAFMPPDVYNELQIDTRGEFGGIGIVISVRQGFLTVVAPIEGTPASRAGIKAMDRILEVDGEVTKDMTVMEAVKKMRGPKGTEVTLTIMRDDFEKSREFSLVRDIIPIDSVHYTSLKPGYGYIRVTNFQDNTQNELIKALDDLASGEQALKGVILDLRDNPGGLLGQAVSAADLFLKDGDIVSMKGRQNKHTKVYRAHPDGMEGDFSMVVLINSGSASASEILAGALQDHGRAVVLGTTSFGKGSVQSVEPLREGYGIKLTIAKYYTPSGRSIQAEGIVPDITVRAGTVELVPVDQETKRITEADLQNHLDGDREGEDDEEAESGEEGADSADETVAYGELSVERLMKDFQVNRALEIMIGHHILSGK